MKKYLLIIPLFLLFTSSVSADWINPREHRPEHPDRDKQDMTFPSCPRPRGETVAFYAEGLHAIVGEPINYVTGADAVYDVGNKNYVQCFCPTEGWNGIQTDWLHSDNVADDKVEKLLKKGWFEIPEGTGWGLPEGKYFAKNSDFLCVRKLIHIF